LNSYHYINVHKELGQEVGVKNGCLAFVFLYITKYEEHKEEYLTARNTVPGEGRRIYV